MRTTIDKAGRLVIPASFVSWLAQRSVCRRREALARPVRETRNVRYRRVTRQFVSLRPLPETDLLNEQLNRILVGPTRWRPAADVYETHDAITVNVDLAGVDEEDLEMQLYQDALVVEGLRRPKASAEDAQYHLAEIRHGRFRLEIRLPARVDQEAIEGRYDRGLLTITLPKTTTTVQATTSTGGTTTPEAIR